MRMLIDYTLPHEPFNSMVRDGTVGKKMLQILDDISPEAVYFTEREGKRAGTIIVDVADASMFPVIAEPLFLTFNADVHWHMVYGPDDLERAGLEEIGQKYS